MTPNEYQDWTQTTALYPEQGELIGLVYASLGLAGEAGEFADHVKKIIRDDNKVMSPSRKELMIRELGDVQYYIARLATELDMSLEEIMLINQEKINKRLLNKTINGSGDHR